MANRIEFCVASIRRVVRPDIRLEKNSAMMWLLVAWANAKKQKAANEIPYSTIS